MGKGGDDSGLNGVKLFCHGGGAVTSKTQTWGSWGDRKDCPGSNNPVIGFRIKIESNQGGGDDTAANTMDLYCQRGGSITGDAVTAYGDWSNWLTCPDGMAVVGLQTRVEGNQGGADDTALNGVKLTCAGYTGYGVSQDTAVADAAPVAAETAKPVEDVPAPVEDVPAPVEDVPAGFVAHYWGSCPVSHPYAYNTGSHCCKSNKEKVYAPQGKSCDGSAIAFDSTCCKGNQWVACPKGPGKCMNNIGGSCPVSHPYAYNLVHTVANQTKKRCTHHKGSYAMEVQLLSTVHVAKETNGSLVLKVLGNARTT